MLKSFFAAAVVASVAVLVWHQGRFGALILLDQPLPAQFFAFGDAREKCQVFQPVRDLGFCEDIIPWHAPGRDARALLSCDTGRLSWNTVMGPLRDPTPRGAIWVYDYAKGDDIRKLELENFPAEADFHPLGIAVSNVAGSSKHTLFVVNHGRHNSTIEVFELNDHAPSTAKFVRTLTDSRFRSPNAIAATSPSSFYVTQDHTFTRRLPSPFDTLAPLETILGLPFGWVDHVSFTQHSIDIARSANGIPFANGITMDITGTSVAVASSSVGRVNLFRRTPSSGKLTRETTIQLPFGPDNVHFDDARLIVTGHPSLKHLIARARNKTHAAPASWVVSVEPRVSRQDDADELLLTPHPIVRQPDNYVVRTLYQSDGRRGGWQSSTSAVLDERTGVFLVTGLYSHGVLRCTT